MIYCEPFETRVRYDREHTESQLGRENFKGIPPLAPIEGALAAVSRKIFPKMTSRPDAEDPEQKRRLTGLAVSLNRAEFEGIPTSVVVGYLRAKMKALVASIPMDCAEYRRLEEGTAWLSVSPPDFRADKVEWPVFYRASYHFDPVADLKFEKL